MLYWAPELFMSPEFMITRHVKADVWSLGMVLIEALRGSPLVKTEIEMPLTADVVLAKLIKTLGSPSEADLKALDPTASDYVLPRHVARHRPQLWYKVLSSRRVDLECAQVLDRMLDWNPATREPAASLLCFPYFEKSRAERCKYKAATQCKPTSAEIEAMISLAFDAHERRLATEREVATWMSPHQSPESESSPTTAGVVHSRHPRRDRPSIMARRSSLGSTQARSTMEAPRLVTIYEDPHETRSRTQAPETV
jgi:serine/threonine protein kinase